MPLGDVIWKTVKIGQLDLINSEASFHGIDIYEDINDPFGSPLIEINVVDPIDALNKYKLTGSYDANDVEVSFTYEPTGEVVGFKGKMHSTKNLSDRMSTAEESSGHMKQYQIRAVQPEFFKAQGKQVEKSFSGPTTKHVEDIIKTISDKQVETITPSEPKDKTFAREHPIDAVQKLISDHSSTKSSTYAVFQQWKNGQPKIIQADYMDLLTQQPVVTLKERTDVNSTGVTEQDLQDSIMYSEYDPSWSEPRAMSKSIKKSFNNATHTVVDESLKPDYPTPWPAYNQPATYVDVNDNYSAEDTVNNSAPHTGADASVKRAKFLSHLSQGEATIEITGNPKITLGSVVNLALFDKTDSDSMYQEGQFNNNALVVSIRHKIKPAGQSPRYTMVLELVKGGMVSGGQTA